MTPAQKALAAGAWKSAVSSICGVVLANFVDVPQALFSWPWFRHILIAMFFVVAVSEARFWSQWANSGNHVTPPPVVAPAKP
jgi:hypothetical protein